MKIVFLLLALFQYLILNSQNYGDAWIIGYDRDSTTWPKYGKTILDFSNGKLETNYTFGEPKPNLGFTNASLASKSGKLRYFTDGYHIFNGEQNIIPNGDSINFGPVWVDFNDVYPTEYNHVFLPMPGEEENETILLHYNIEYYPQFTKRFTYAPYFKIAKIKWNSNTNKDTVLFKDSIILKGDFIIHHMACTRHANGRDWWIIIEDYLTNNHRIFLLDPNGINLKKNQEIGIVADSFDWTGNALFTPDGGRYIKFLRGYQIQIFDFDRCTGELSNNKVIIDPSTFNKDLCYIEVSPNSRFLYLNSDSLIWQYDLFASDIKSTETIVGAWDGYYFLGLYNTNFNQMSLGNDGKIYISCRSSSNLAHVINNPNEKGANCNFQLRGLEFEAFMLGNFPNLPNYKLGALTGSTCDTITSISNKFEENGILIYPNPATSFVIINEIDGIIHSSVKLQIFDINGKICYSNEYHNLQKQIKIPLLEFPQGLYLVQISDINGNYWLNRFIKN